LVFSRLRFRRAKNLLSSVFPAPERRHGFVRHHFNGVFCRIGRRQRLRFQLFIGYRLSLFYRFVSSGWSTAVSSTAVSGSATSSGVCSATASATTGSG
jgi:hypothetical protein